MPEEELLSTFHVFNCYASSSHCLAPCSCYWWWVLTSALYASSFPSTDFPFSPDNKPLGSYSFTTWHGWPEEMPLFCMQHAEGVPQVARRTCSASPTSRISCPPSPAPTLRAQLSPLGFSIPCPPDEVFGTNRPQSWAKTPPAPFISQHELQPAPGHDLSEPCPDCFWSQPTDFGEWGLF